MSSAGKVVIKIIAEADTKAFGRMEKRLEKLAAKHWMTIRASKNLKNAMANSGKAIFKTVRGVTRLVKSLTPLPGVTRNAGSGLKDMGGALKAAAAAAKDATIAVAEFGAVAGKAYAGLIKKAAGLAKSMGMVAGKTAVGGMVALGGAAIVGARSFASLDQQMRELGVVAGIDQEVIKTMLAEITKGSAGAIFSALETAEAMTVIGAMGNYSASEIEDLTEMSQKLAVASGFDDITKSSETLVGAMRTFGFESGESAKMAEILMQASNVSALSMDDLGTALQFVGGRANQMGLSVNETLAALGTLRNMNIDAGIASRSLSQAFGHLIDPSKEGAKWMRRLGLEATNSDGSFRSLEEIVDSSADAYAQLLEMFGGDEQRALQVMTEMFGEMGSRAMIPLISSLDDTENGFRAMGVSMEEIPATLLQDNFDRMAASAQNQMKGLQHTIDALGLTMGSALLGPLMDTEDGPSVIQALSDAFTQPEFLGALTMIGESFGQLAAEFLPMLSRAMVELAPTIADIVKLLTDLLGSEEVKAFVMGLIVIVKKLFGYLMPVLNSLMPVIKQLFKALIPFLPVLDFLAFGFSLLLGLLGPVLKIFIALLNVLAPFIPILLMFGSVILKALVTPLVIWMNVLADLITLAAGFIGIFDKDLAASMTNVASEFRGMGDEINDAADSLADFDYEASAATLDYDTLVAQSTETPQEVGSDPTARPSTITNIIIEGDVKDDETLEKIVDEVTRDRGIVIA